jgi:G3E family GTPase
MTDSPASPNTLMATSTSTRSVTLVCGLSTTWRDRVAASMARSQAGSLLVEIGPQTADEVRVTARHGSGDTVVGSVALEVDHCCVSCTMLAQLPALIRSWAAHAGARVFVALPPAMEPSALRHTLEGAAGVDQIMAPDGVVTVVDAVLLHSHLSGDDLLAERGLQVAETDRRSVAEVVSRQIENADLVALCNADRLSEAASGLAHALVGHIGPQAQVVTASAAGELLTPDTHPHPESDRVSTLTWQGQRPLHPERFASSVPHIVAPLLRSQGHICLANRPDQLIAWESAGASAAIGDIGPRDHKSVETSELTMIGVDLDAGRLTRLLESCLLTDAEFARGPELWHVLQDSFAEALDSKDH